MTLTKTLEKIVSPARLGWQGILIAGAGAGAAYFLDSAVADIVGGGVTIAGVLFYFDSLTSFVRTIKNIKKCGVLDKRFIEPHLYYYCNRQGARTAAANYGMAEDFGGIMRNYDGKMELTFIPHI